MNHQFFEKEKTSLGTQTKLKIRDIVDHLEDEDINEKPIKEN